VKNKFFHPSLKSRSSVYNQRSCYHWSIPTIPISFLHFLSHLQTLYENQALWVICSWSPAKQANEKLKYDIHGVLGPDIKFHKSNTKTQMVQLKTW